MSNRARNEADHMPGADHVVVVSIRVLGLLSACIAFAASASGQVAIAPRSAFPAKYRGGAFVAFHGSHDRSPTQAGYLVAFVPSAAAKPGGDYEEFATGFAGAKALAAPTEAAHRPMGLAVSPDGALYVSDDVKGRIWRITNRGGVGRQEGGR